MKTTIFAIVITFLFFLPYQVNAQTGGGGESYPELNTNKEILTKWQDHRFGLFIHWGPVAMRGTEIGWSRGRQVPIRDYDQLYQTFNPVLFDASEWVRAAKEAGMKYLIITSKHHDGFCLWDSEYTDYDMTSTPYGEDIIEKLSKECKKQDLQFGLYYSIADWHHPDNPVVYPAEDYQLHGKTGFPDQTSRESMERYTTYMKNQLKELIERYDPEILWFDGEWEWVWTHQMGMDLYAYLRGLKDDLLINNRIDKGREGMEGITKGDEFAGDFATPEQQVGRFDNQYPWESCITIAKQWAWRPNDKMKTVEESIHTLLRTVGGDGNLLYNVGPMPDGRMEKRQIDTLKAMGMWLEKNGEAVYGTRGGPWLPNENFISTRKGNKIFIHLLNHPGRQFKLALSGDVKINKSYFLSQGAPVKLRRSGKTITINLPQKLPDALATVLVLEAAGDVMSAPIIKPE